MCTTELEDIINYFGERIQIEDFNLKLGKKTILEIISRKIDIFENFKEDIKSKWEYFKHNSKINNKSYLIFLYYNFNDFFRSFLENFFGINQETCLELLIYEKVSSTDIIIEYKYHLSENIEIIGKSLNILNNNNQEFLFPITFFFFYYKKSWYYFKRYNSREL